MTKSKEEEGGTRDGQLRKEKSHSVWLWGCERKKRTRGGEEARKKDNPFMENRVMLGC